MDGAANEKSVIGMNSKHFRTFGGLVVAVAVAVVVAVVQVCDCAVVGVEEGVWQCVFCVGGEWKVGATFVNGVNDGLDCRERDGGFVAEGDCELDGVSDGGGVWAELAVGQGPFTQIQ